MENSAATSASAVGGPCTSIEENDIKTEPLEPIPEQHLACASYQDDGLLIEPSLQHVFLQPAVLSLPVVLRVEKENPVSSSLTAAVVAVAANESATNVLSSTSVALTKTADYSISKTTSAAANPSAQFSAVVITDSVDLQVASTSATAQNQQMQKQHNIPAKTGGANATFFRRKKAIPLAVVKKLGSNKPSKITSSEVPIEEVAERSREHTTEASVAILHHASTPTETLALSKDMHGEQESFSTKPPTTFRRLRPKVSIMPYTKPPKKTINRSSDHEEASPLVHQDSLLPSVTGELNDPHDGKNQNKDFVIPSGDSSKRPVVEPSGSTVDAIDHDKTKLNEKKNCQEQKDMVASDLLPICSRGEIIEDKYNETQQACMMKPSDDSDVQSGEFSFDLLANAKVQSSPSPGKNDVLMLDKQHHRLAAPDPKNDKENLLFPTKVSQITANSTTVEETSLAQSDDPQNRAAEDSEKSINECTISQPVAATSVGPMKTIKRTIKLGKLPLDLAKQLKSAMGISQARSNAKLSASTVVEKKHKLPVQRTFDVKDSPLHSKASTAMKLREVDNRNDLSQNKASQHLSTVTSSSPPNRSSGASTEPVKVSTSHAVICSPTTSKTVDPGALIDSHRKTESMKPLRRSGKDSTVPLEAQHSENVLSPTLAESMNHSPTSGNKKITKISYLTPLQRKMLMSSLVKGKPKCADTEVNQATLRSCDTRVEKVIETTASSRTELNESTLEHRFDDSFMADVATTHSISTTTPITPIKGCNSAERKVQIISHVILPKLTFSSCSGEGNSTSQYATNEQQNSPEATIHPTSSTSPSSSFVERSPTASVYDQYPKLFVIHSTAPFPSKGIALPSTSPAGTNATVQSAMPEAYDTGGIQQEMPAALEPSTPEPKHNQPALIATVLPRTPSFATVNNDRLRLFTTDAIVADPPDPCQETYPVSMHETLPVEHRIVPRIVIDKSFVEHDSQSSSSSSSSVSSREHAATFTSMLTVGNERKSKLHQHGAEGRQMEGTTIDIAPEVQPQSMGCSLKTRDKLRQRVLQNLESQRKPEVPPIRRAYSRKPQTVSVTCEKPEKEMHVQPVDLRMQSAAYSMEEQLNINQSSITVFSETRESLHADNIDFFTHCLDLDSQETTGFQGFSYSSIREEQLESSKKLRIIESLLEAERIKLKNVGLDVKKGSIQQEHANDRSRTAAVPCYESDSTNSPDDLNDHYGPLQDSGEVIVDDEEYDLTPQKRMTILSSMQSPHGCSISSDELLKSTASLSSFCGSSTAPVNSQGHPVVKVEVLPGEHIHAAHDTVLKSVCAVDMNENAKQQIDGYTLKLLEATDENTHSSTGRVTCGIDLIDHASSSTNIVENIVERGVLVEERTPFIGNRTAALGNSMESNLFQNQSKRSVPVNVSQESTSMDATSTITPAGTSKSLSTVSTSEPGDHEMTGVDLIVAMAMSMKKDEGEDDEHSDADFESVCEVNRSDNVKDYVDDKTLESPTTIIEEQSVNASVINDKKRRNTKRNEFLDLLLRHVNYDSLMDELLHKRQREKEVSGNLSSSAESDDSERESLNHLAQYLKDRVDPKTTSKPVTLSTCTQQLSAVDGEANHMIVKGESERKAQASDVVKLIVRSSTDEGPTSDEVCVNTQGPELQVESEEMNTSAENMMCSEIMVQRVKHTHGDYESYELNSISMELPSDSVKNQEESSEWPILIDETQQEPQRASVVVNEQPEESCQPTVSSNNEDSCNAAFDESTPSNSPTTSTRKEQRQTDGVEALESVTSETAIESSVEFADMTATICDKYNNDILESTAVSTNSAENVTGCVLTQTVAEEAINSLASCENVLEVVDVVQTEETIVEDSAFEKAAVSAGRSNRGRPARGRKRSNKMSPVAISAKQKKQLNLLDIKPLSPPVLDSSEAPVANEVVSDCSTDGFSAVDRPSTVQRVKSRHSSKTSRVSKELDAAQSEANELENASQSQTDLKKNKNNKAGKHTISKVNDECSSKMKSRKTDNKHTKVVSVSKSTAGGGSGGSVKTQSNVEQNTDCDPSNLQRKTKANEQKRSRSVSAKVNKNENRRRSARRSGSRKSRRSNSSSSSRVCSSDDSNREVADVSSDDALRVDERVTRGAKRRKLKRKKRSTPRGQGTDTVSVTTTSTTSRILRATGSSTRRSTKLSKASVLSKASNTDEQYVISEIDSADESGSTCSVPQRILEVVNVRYHQVLQMAESNTIRQTRSSVINPVRLNEMTQTKAKASAIDRSREAVSSGIGSGQSGADSSVAPVDTSSTTTLDHGEKILHAKRGRPPKPLIESEDTLDEGVTVVKCGNCSKEVQRSAWKEHYISHNGVAHRVGIDDPIDLKDIKAVGYAIMLFMRNHRRFEVICEKCGEIKKSFLGMASHLATCGMPKEEKDSSKVACEHCGRKMLVVSLPSHLTFYCRVLKAQRQKELSETSGTGTAGAASPSENAAEQLTASGRQKRRSVACAEKKIRKLAREAMEEPKELIIKVTGETVSMGILQSWLIEMKDTGQASCRHNSCFFVGSSEKIMRTHNEICPYGIGTVPVFECAICYCQDQRRDVVYEHIRQMHAKELIRFRLQSAPSDSDSDKNVLSSEMVNGSSDTDEMEVDSSMVVEDETTPTSEKKTGSKKRPKPATPKPKKGPPKSKKGNTSKKATSLEEDMQNEMAIVGEEGEVYKEMVLEEAYEYRQQRTNIQFTTIQWMLKFHREYYDNARLFPRLRPDVDARFLPILAIVDYLPKSSLSMRFRLRKIKLYDAPYVPNTSDSWQRLAPFQGETLDGESMFYCGGPVMALDWLPIPSNLGDAPVDQILAIACKSKYAEFYTCQQLSKPRQCKCLIQIWNVGPLRNASGGDETGTRSPQLSFAIACDFGPIWQLAFCPSGCYNEINRGDQFDRLGLLAATGSDGDVYMFALNRSMVDFQEDYSEFKPIPRITKLKPALRLSLSLNRRQSTSAESNAIRRFTGHSVMRIAWTREKDHAVFSAGYSNGTVAVWKLTEASFCSTLLGALKDGIRTLLPTHKVLHASGSCITGLDLHYMQNSRFLAVTNTDRRLKVYDLQSGHHQPQEVLNVQVRSRITALRWLLHYPVLVFVYDDMYMADRCGYTVHQPRDIGIRMLPLVMLGTEATDLAENEWISTNAVTTDGGDVVCHKPTAFVTGIQTKGFGQILTTTTAFRLNPSAAPVNVSSYDAFDENYGLLFSDTDENPLKSDRKSLQVKSLRRGNNEHYPAVRLNQIRWNPNSSSFLYYAIGYQAGFVRIRKIQV